MRFLNNNGLSISVLSLFLLTIIGQTFAGLAAYNDQERDHHQSAIGLGAYLRTGAFWEAVGENWESEFLQMGMFVVLTVFLFQKGSAESKDPDSTDEPVDADPRLVRDDPRAPGPVRRGGWRLRLYSHSLSLAFLFLFLMSFVIHALGGAADYNHDRALHGEAPIRWLAYIETSRFWFESFQNWQSEFLSIGAMVTLTVFLREKGSPESKPVATPHGESGD